MPFLQLHPHVPQPLRVQRYRSSTALSAMAKAPEDMTFEDLEAVCAGYCCRALTVPFVSGALPLGSWSHVNFPMADIEEHDGNPAVHYIHVITRHSMEIFFGDLALQYKNAIMHKDLDLLRRPFGPKVAVPKDTKLQFIVLDSVDGTVTVFKHYIFPQKCKPSFVKNISFGRLYRPNFMSQKSTVGKQILQHCLQNMGGHQFRCFDILTEVAPGHSKTKAFDGVLARKEFDWPLPLTERFYRKWALQMLEEVWNFDVASLVMLGEPNTGKSPLCRSILIESWALPSWGQTLSPNHPWDWLSEGRGRLCCHGRLPRWPRNAACRHQDLEVFSGRRPVRIDGVGSMGSGEMGAKSASCCCSQRLWGQSWWRRSPCAKLAFPKVLGNDRPAISDNASNADVNAILKRSVFIVVTKGFVYHRQNGVNEDPVSIGLPWMALTF